VSLIPEPYVVCHKARRFSGNYDSHGNAKLETLSPVIRRAQSLHQGAAYPRSAQVVSDEYQQRINTTIFMAVNEPTLYEPGDEVLLFGTVDANGDYVGGTAYRVDGVPTDDRNGPWKQFYAAFGGVVTLARVT
jgi:hypothetical protein